MISIIPHYETLNGFHNVKVIKFLNDLLETALL
jgi:hypothetical protein